MYSILPKLLRFHVCLFYQVANLEIHPSSNVKILAAGFTKTYRWRNILRKRAKPAFSIFIISDVSRSTYQEKSSAFTYIDISKWLDFRVFSDKDVKIVGTSDPLSIGQ